MGFKFNAGDEVVVDALRRALMWTKINIAGLDTVDITKPNERGEYPHMGLEKMSRWGKFDDDITARLARGEILDTFAYCKLHAYYFPREAARCKEAAANLKMTLEAFYEVYAGIVREYNDYFHLIRSTVAVFEGNATFPAPDAPSIFDNTLFPAIHRGT